MSHPFLPFLAGVLAVILWTSCSPSSKEQIGVSEDPRLQHSFTGYYKTCETITFGFGENGRFACELKSTDFVGRFRDVVWGSYSVDSTHINLQVDKYNTDNLKYNSLPITLADSLVFVSSGDSLRIYFDNEGSAQKKEESVLSPAKKITSFSTAANTEGEARLAVIVILMLFFRFLELIAPFALAGLLVWLLIKKYRQKRGQE